MKLSPEDMQQIRQLVFQSIIEDLGTRMDRNLLKPLHDKIASLAKSIDHNRANIQKILDILAENGLVETDNE